MWLNCLERVPPADSRDDARVHLFVYKQSLCESAPEVVARHVVEIVVAGRVGRALGRACDHGPDTALGEVDDRLVAVEVLRPDVPVDVSLSVTREVGVARLPATPGRVLPLRHAESELVAVGSPFHVFLRDLRDLERSNPDEPAELYHEGVAATSRSQAKLFKIVVCEPALVLVLLAGGL